ncbi:MAG: tetratricopeptide repeat protein [Anaerolineae bacterium]|nr:tetratricopeptide repeat protein [Anaerolineae bacterium]
MAGNRRAYDGAIKRAANLVWNKHWSRAIDEYSKALAEFPNDLAALTGLGLAYAETQQLEQALSAYKQAANQAPDNPEVMQRVAHTMERMAMWRQAASIYVRAAEAHLRLRDVPQAVEMWHRAAVLDPENVDAHRNLGKAYENDGEPLRAAHHYLVLARVSARQGQQERALEHATRAHALAPRNVEAGAVVEALRTGRPLPDGPTARLQPDAEGKRTLDSFVVFEDIELGVGRIPISSERASPADMLREHSLAQMADAVFAEGSTPDNVLLAQAADYAARGVTTRAIDAYVRALDKGSDSPAIRFNLGMLYQDQGDHAQAITHLRRALSDPEFELGAHFAIGETYHRWDRNDRALEHLLRVLAALDAQAVPARHLAALEMTYDSLRRRYSAQHSEEDARRLAQSIISFLSEPGWGQRVIETRTQLDSLAGGALLIPMVEVIGVPEAREAMAAMQRIAGYVRQSLNFTAMEECFWAIQHAPYYLPLHLRLADVLIHKGQRDEAVAKYVAIAESFKSRGDLDRAIALYEEALRTVPMDIGVRKQLIATLLEGSMHDAAIEQYIAVADAYYQLAQINKALETYEEALSVASRGSPDRQWETNILYRIGDIHVQRVDWAQAVRAYRRIVGIDAAQDRARVQMIDLYYKLRNPDQALRELEELIAVSQAREQPRQQARVLVDVAKAVPSQLSLHIRLAKAFLGLHMKAEALTELDTVSQLQLQAGQTGEAARTIRAILRLAPADPHEYERRLAEIAAM